MNSLKTTVDFSNALTSDDASTLLIKLTILLSKNTNSLLNELSHFYQDIDNLESNLSKHSDFKDLQSSDNEYQATEALIKLFNSLFVDQRVQLIRAEVEPEYFPASMDNFARIEFAHGFFASALHEISHWCIAGKARRQLSDFGYWYAADGRNEAQQQAFERVEIKPQALECLFTLACRRPFQVSQDNLFADFDTSNSSFANDVYRQVKTYLSEPQKIPLDAQRLLQALLTITISL